MAGIACLIRDFYIRNYEIHCVSNSCTIIETHGTKRVSSKILNKFNQGDVARYEINKGSHQHSRKGWDNGWHDIYTLHIVLKNGEKINTHAKQCYNDKRLKSLASSIINMEDVHYKSEPW